jgi:Methyltransferase FkbM domain
MALKERFKRELLARGWFCSKAACDDQVTAFLSAMRPIATDKPLIRLGPAADGGYLIPDDLDGVRYCFSPGVANSSAFEADLASRGIQSFMADYSVDGPATASPMFHFSKRYLGAITDNVFITLSDWIQQSISHNDGDLILQMDIEGSEYDVIFQTPEEIWKRFRIVVIEFHDLNTVFQPLGLKLLSLCMSKLLSVFDMVHIHPNNGCGLIRRGELEIPRMIEVTLLRKDRVGARQPAALFPHPLDRPNFPNEPVMELPGCWYRP